HEKIPMIGRVFLGRYEAVRLLGEGGMGRVYLARQLDNGREVVVKVLHDEIAAQPKCRDGFQQEMDFLARFRHPHVVALHDASADPEGLCLVMEYIPGMTLDQLRRCHRRLTPERTGRLLGQLCLALHAAEALRIVHRDLKPANIMVVDPDTPGEKLKVMDFGLAKLGSALYIPKERLDNPTAFFSACGTPDYICPEQYRGDEVDHRSDLYSVGVILFELLTGQVPFARPTVALTLQAHGEARPPSFAEMGTRDVPAAVEEVVRGCLAKYPNERPQTARELAGRYEKALGEKLVRPEDWVLPPGLRESGVRPALPPALRKPADPHTLVHQLEAWMPERIAVIKLQGFVHDHGGEVAESVPGMIRVRLGQPVAAAPPRSGLFARLVSGRRPEPPEEEGIELELHMERPDSADQGRLRITVLMRPAGNRKRPPDPGWRGRCEEIQRDLRAYLIGRG
ncbi:MAG TPA: serine/threonine-protein kinase, partial [Gemmataceae bacterium]|nr:serine/threonine-protein kinase [Gemmataceae bacterium]